jgi:hypothetical protein
MARLMKLRLPVLLLYLLSVLLPAQSQNRAGVFTGSYQLLPSNTYVQAKNYYLLTLFDQVKPVRQLLERDSDLTRLLQTKRDSIAGSITRCGTARLCYTSPMLFSATDIALVSTKLGQLYARGNELDKLVTEQLIPSGCYQLFSKLPPKEMLMKAWEQDARGINFVLSVYANGQKPNYPAIDSIGFAVNDRRYAPFLKILTETLAAELKTATLFFDPSLTAALRFLEVNDREQAADFEPMAQTVNLATLAKARKMNWKNYPYTLLLVLGSGPQDYATALSGDAKMRLRMVATRYREGLAPIIMVSGGRVHPYKTKYCEAEEMKRYLIETLRIPADAILMDPHARHTTTNVRNTVRLIYRYGLPPDKPCVVSSASSHITSVMSEAFDQRCLRELKMVPFRKGNRISPTEGEFYPVIDALHINPTEPMDP